MPQSTVKHLRSTDGTTLFAEATGDPRNLHLVLVSGLSLSGCVFDDLCADKRLLESLYIVRYDIRGHGRSGKPTTTDAYESKRFAEDFRTVMDAFELKKPVLTGCMGGAIATDVVSHLPLGTLSGIIYLSGVPATTVVGEIAAPPLAAALPALKSNESVSAYQDAATVFNDRLWADPETIPYAVRCLHHGHSLSPAIMSLSLARPMEVENLWRAGQDGLPLLVVQGTSDGHRVGGAKSIDEIVRPHFKNYEILWLEGRGHALHYECPNEVVEQLIKFTQKFGGKDYRAL
ncbi:alpha/beta-hydrolase [Mycena belliarum]|uniref:Alpha/beta-hydrolase n=1 Tax=Mycena belliarum TaxID=1033014 RepID=A0AAD6UEQ6_9AGAR|nr:alpha/beta-hydrolase [Mycena belliae]